MSTVRSKAKPARSEPAWDVAHLFPSQGEWTEADYFALPDVNRIVELSDGFIEVSPLPTTSHQLILSFFFRSLLDFVEPRNLGTALFAALPVRLGRGRVREPDVVFMLTENSARIGEQYWEGADLVMEVVSKGKKNRQRDLEKKLREYAEARIPEYWIVDPQKALVMVWRLKNRHYVVHGEYGRGNRAESILLPGFLVDVDALLSGKYPRGPVPPSRA